MRTLTVRRLPFSSIAVLTALLLSILLAIPVPASAAGQVLNCSLPVAGTVTAIDAKAGTFTMTVTSNGVGSATAWVQKASVIVVREIEAQTQVVVTERAARFSDLRVGDRVLVQAMCLDDGRLLVLTGAILHMTSGGTSGRPTAPSGGSVAGKPPTVTPNPPIGPPQPGGPTVPSGPVIIVGTVIGKTTVGLTIGGKSLATVTVKIDAGTRVSGQRAAFADIMINDTVRIEALRGTGGLLQAKSIAVLTVAVKTITGTITARGNGFIIIDGTLLVRVTADTVILVDGVVKSVTDLVVGSKVTVTVNAVVEKAKDTATSTTANVKATADAVVITVLKLKP